MRPTTMALTGLLAALSAALAMSQGFTRGTARSHAPASDETSSDSQGGDEAPAPAKEKKRAKAAADEPADEDEAPAPRRRRKAADPKAAVEEYLRSRLASADKGHRDQKAYGEKLSDRWQKFFDSMYEDRKRFETSIARQRLNLFETMSSVGPGYRAQAVKDFEQMQGTMLKSFDSSQRQKTDEFFARLLEDVKGYGLDQDRKREAMMGASMDAWKDQKGMLDESEPARKGRKSRD